jgi:hypothetical protein
MKDWLKITHPLFREEWLKRGEFGFGFKDWYKN